MCMIVEKNTPFIALLWHKEAPNDLKNYINHYVSVYGISSIVEGKNVIISIGTSKLNGGINYCFTTTAMKSNQMHIYYGLLRYEKEILFMDILFYKECSLSVSMLEEVFNIKEKVNKSCSDKLEHQSTLNWNNNI